MEQVWEELATEIAEDFASDYLKDYERMSDRDLSKLREDLKRKIEKETKPETKVAKEIIISSDSEDIKQRRKRSRDHDYRAKRAGKSLRTVTVSEKPRTSKPEKSPKVVYNPLTRKAESNIKKEKNELSDRSASEDEEPKLSADQMIAELIAENEEEENIKVITDTMGSSATNMGSSERKSKRKMSRENGQSHTRQVLIDHGQHTPILDEPPTRSRYESSSSETLPPVKVKSKWVDDTSDEEEVPKANLPPNDTHIPHTEDSDVLGGLYDENGEHMDDQDENVPFDFYYPAIQGCRQVDDSYKFLNRVAEGTYGIVFRAVDKKSGDICALKRLKMEKEKLGFPITSLREIVTLLKSKHENVINVLEICVGSTKDKIFIAMEFLEHDLKTLMETMKSKFTIGEVKTLMKQLLSGVHHLHDNWILHRDLKTSNLLLNHKGCLKIADFGLAREYGSPLGSYTQVVVTLWYRSPELLLGQKTYSTYIDIWSCGCIMGEFLQGKPLFPGKTEQEQVKLIFKELGTPDESKWPGFSELPHAKKVQWDRHPYNMLRKRFKDDLTKIGYNFLNGLLCYNPDKRLTAETALEQDWFKESPIPTPREYFPTWPAKSELNAMRAKSGITMASPEAPTGATSFHQLAGKDYRIV